MSKNLLISAGLTLATMATPVFAKKKDVKQPNVILVMADDMGWGDTGYNGHKRIKTPNLDDMASNGVRFNRFYSASSVCSPTRGSCLTGRNPYRYGIFTANKGHLKKEEVTLAEVFKSQGYTTGHFGKWHLGTLSSDFSGKGKRRKPEKNYMTPTMAGFDEWFSTEYAVATYDPYVKDKEHFHGNLNKISESDYWKYLYWENGRPVEKVLKGCDTEIIMDKAIPFIENAAKSAKPFFTVIWLHAPHAPVVGHPKYMKELYSDLPEGKRHYYSVITALDAQVGRLRKKLKELGVADNTVLCFTSDNGPEGNPHPRKRYQGSAKNLRGRKRSLYEGGIRVPGIIEWPSYVRPHVSDVPAVTSDYFPTMCKVLGFKMKDSRPIDGINILKQLKGKGKKRKKAIGFQFSKQKALIDNNYKLVYNKDGKKSRSDNGTKAVKEYELYDLKKDPSETNDISAQNIKRVERMKKQLWEWVKSCESSNADSDY